MIGHTAYVQDGRPRQEFISLWRVAGVAPGLPRWISVVNPDGTPHWRFIALCRQAFGLSPGQNLPADVPIFDEGGRPTLAMMEKWSEWTSW